MAEKRSDKLNRVHPRMLRIQGEGDPQALGMRLVGQAIETALTAAGLTKQEAAFAMGYADSGVMGRWVAGTETPQLAKLWTLGPKFQCAFVIALASSADGIEIETTLRVRRA